MGQVVPFIRRVRESAEWTAEERARLEALADQLGAEGVRVEVVFGATDAGDPWCVVSDEHGDVLIHVARIDGRFVVHSAVDDVLSEGADLHAALRERLEAVEAPEPQSAMVLPFAARQGQTFLALVAAAAFFYETAGLAEPAEAAELPKPAAGAEAPPPPPPPEADAPAQERELAVQGAALRDPEVKAQVLAVATAKAAPASAATVEPAPAEPAPLPTSPQTEAPPAVDLAAGSEPPVTIQGTDADDVLIGTGAGEHILGGGGDDTLSGGGGRDLLEGGAGDDRIELTSEAVAVGGEGADTFVIQAPVRLSDAGTLLGVILDFEAGDRIVTASGRAVQVGQPSGAPPTPAGFGTATAGGGGPPPTVLLGNFQTVGRTEVDLDQDGVIDGYVLVLSRNQGDAPGAPVYMLGPDPTDARRVLIDVDGDGASDGAIPLVRPGDDTLMMVGRSLLNVDPFGA